MALLRMTMVKWVCESARPFDVVEDRAFLYGMKTGPNRPNLFVPKSQTLSRYVRIVYNRSRKLIRKTVKVWLAFFLFRAASHHYAELWGSTQHKHQHMVITKPWCICRPCCPLYPQRMPSIHAPRHHGSRQVPLRKNIGADSSRNLRLIRNFG